VKLRSYKKLIKKVFCNPEADDVRYFSGHVALATCLRRTALYWEPGMGGGEGDPYLCQEDVITFEDLVVEHAENMKCFSTREALAIVHCLRQARQHKAITLLRSIGSDGLADDLLPRSITRPEPSWLDHFYKTIRVSIINPLLIETARR
jgi:hypothetical protein